jgi:hypothetical protein
MHSFSPFKFYICEHYCHALVIRVMLNSFYFQVQLMNVDKQNIWQIKYLLFSLSASYLNCTKEFNCNISMYAYNVLIKLTHSITLFYPLPLLQDNFNGFHYSIFIHVFPPQMVPILHFYHFFLHLDYTYKRECDICLSQGLSYLLL